MRQRHMVYVLAVLSAGLFLHSPVHGACCYFSAKNTDILQPAQKVFITWDPEKKVETFTVQPKFEGNALDFGMVIPTPSQPKLHEMPRDFFKHLAVYTILKKRELPQSKLIAGCRNRAAFGEAAGGGKAGRGGNDIGCRRSTQAPPTVVVLGAGVVGSLDYKIIAADRADDLFQWLKDNKYSYAGDEATLNFYVKKKWLFTVMKIDTMQMKKNKDGTFAGEVTPTRFQFTSEQARLSAQDHADLGEGQDRGAVLRAGAAQGRSAGRHELPVHLGADAAGGFKEARLEARSLPQCDTAGRGDDWLAAIQGPSFPTCLLTTSSLATTTCPATAHSQSQGPHADHHGMGPQADRARHGDSSGNDALRRESARRG